MTEINIDQIKNNPTLYFNRPIQVLKNQFLNREDKIAILKSWEYDEREMAVAEEENMTPMHEHKNVLDKILKALIKLEAKKDADLIAPTKQGG